MWLWVSVIVLCLIIEASTFSLTTIWAALAALPLVFLSRTALPFRWQLLAWVVLTIVLIALTRPFALKRLKVLSKSKTNVNALIGQSVIITKDTSNFEKGQAKSKNGVIWQVSNANISQGIIRAGTVCKVFEVRGNTLLVEPLVEPSEIQSQ